MAESGEETKSIQKQVYEPLGREARMFFVDVHRMANKNRSRKNDENHHIYSVDGENFNKAAKITDIPAKANDVLYVDVIPVELTEEFIELLRRGVRVFYLRRATMLAKKREELGLLKTARNDIRAMIAIEPRWFREVNEDILVMRRLTCAYRSLLKSHQSLLNRMKALSGVERDVLKDAIKDLEKRMTTMAKIIDPEAIKRIPSYSRVVEALAIVGDNHLMAREALAEIMPYVERTRSYSRLKAFFGLYKGSKGTVKIYSKPARHALARLTTAVLHKAHHKAKDEERILRRIWKTVKERERLEAPA